MRFENKLVVSFTINAGNMGSPILWKHSETPSVTDNAINPFSVTGNVQTSAYPDKILLQVHGELLSNYDAMH